MPVLREHAAARVIPVLPGETLDDLMRGGFKVIQGRRGYRFSMDSVLAAHFARPRSGDEVLDLGAGSGVISILLCAMQPGCTVTALELQPALADRARRSVALNRLEQKITVVNGDVRRLDSIPREIYHLVTSNPPFWKKGEGRPSLREETLLARHETEGRLEDFIAAAARALRPSGRLVLVQRSSRLGEMLDLFAAHRLEPKRMRFVHPGVKRNANLVLIEAQKGGSPGAVVMPPLVVYDSPGVYSAEINEIYFGEGGM